jgi:hypothetical protein
MGQGYVGLLFIPNSWVIAVGTVSKATLEGGKMGEDKSGKSEVHIPSVKNRDCSHTEVPTA